MSLPGVSAGLVGGAGASSPPATPVTPGAGSSGFTEFRVIVADAAGALNEGPSENYDFVVDAGGVLNLRANLEAGGPGSYLWLYPRAPLTAGAAGYDVEIDAGEGAPASAAVAGGDGADLYLYGGQGGAGSATRVAGAGGDVFINAGQPGASGGAGGANGGHVYVDACDGTGAGVTGSVLIGTQTVSLIGTRYVQVGPAGGSVPLLVAAATPLGAELLSVAPDTNAVSILGRTAICTPIATDEVVVAHVDARASTTQYVIRSAAPSTGVTAPTLINAPGTSGAVYLQLGGSFAAGWRMGDGAGAAHFFPLTANAMDVGTSALPVRDVNLGRDVIGTAGAAHVWYVAAAAAGSGTSGGAATFRAGHGAAATAGVTAANGALGTFAGGNGGAGATGRAPGSGGGAYLFGGDAGTRVDTGNPSGGGVEIRGGEGRVAGAGGSVEIYAGGSGTGGTAGHILLSVADADGTFGYIRIGNSASERVGFYTTTGVAQQTGVAVTEAAIHAALVNLGLITA